MASAASGPKLCTGCGARYPADTLFCPTDGTPLQNAAAPAARRTDPGGTDPYIGSEIAGHIEVRALAGVGAMGRVYRAFQNGVERDVAVKVLHRELSSNAQVVARFNREAKVASRLLHPNVVHVHMAGQLPDGALYIVMEYLDGLSLQSALAASDGAVPLPRALHVALQICDAVGEAHAQGITHRDLKPENVMLVSRGADADFVKVLDFGIARLDWGEQSMATAAGLVFGTARYISPEGAQGEPVGPQGDVYSIATLVYQMLAGRTPFEGDQAVGLLVQQIHDAPPPLKSIARASYVPDPIAEVIHANLAKDKSKRAADARALGRALLEAAKASGLSAEDLVPRSILLGARAPGAVQLQSMQRTRQLGLEKPIDELIAAANAAKNAGAGERVAPGHTEIAEREPQRTAYEVPAEPPSQPRLPRVTVKTPPPSGPSLPGKPGNATVAIAPSAKPKNATVGMVNATASPQAPPVTNATQKWTPPADVRAQMETPPPPSSSVDATMDDASEQPPPALSQRSPHSPRDAAFDSTVRLSPESAPRLPPTVIESASDVSDHELDEPPRWPRWALVLSCFFVGIGAATAIAFRLNLLGPPAPVATGDDLSARAAYVAPAAAPSTPPIQTRPQGAAPVPPLATVTPSLAAMLPTDAGSSASAKGARRGKHSALPEAGAPPPLVEPEAPSAAPAPSPAPSASVKWL